MKKNLYGIFFKVSLFNLLILGLLLYFMNKGWLIYIYSQDISYISLIITLITLITVIYLNYISFRINILQNLITEKNVSEFETKIFKNINSSISKNVENLHLLLFSKIYYSKQISLLATLMGLLGTVLGFIFVLLFIDFSMLKDIENLQNVLESVAVGMGVALYTTLVGTFCSLWIYVLFILMNFDIKKLCFKYQILLDEMKNKNSENINFSESF